MGAMGGEQPAESAAEKRFLAELAPGYVTSDQSSQTRVMRDLMIRTFAPYVRGGRGLELGCEAGYMSERLARLVEHLDIVDGAEHFLNRTRARNIPNARCIVSLFEEFRPEAPYDWVFATHVLEHVLDVGRVLQMARSALKPGGLLFAAVPNARAISRQLARQMGLLKDLYDLTPNDIRGGHRRVYDRESLIRDLESASFEITAQGGIMFKPLADFQMDRLIELGILGPEQLEGLYRLGNEYPDLCADVYAIARPIAGRSEIG